MSKNRLKLILWAVLAVVLVIGLYAAVRGAATLAAYFQQGADPASVLNLVPNVPPEYQPRVEWLPDAPDLVRAVDPYTREQIESAYVRAWLQQNLSYLRGRPSGLATYFTGGALAQVRRAIQETMEQGWQVDQVNTAHRLEVRFISADGAIISITDHRAQLGQIIRNEEGREIFADPAVTARYDVLMLLDDGNWRINGWVRREVDPAQPILLPPETPLPAPATRVAVEPGQLLVDGAPFVAAGVNYYPQATPWDRFWARYDPLVIQQDFALIRSLGLNTIRIFVPFDDFGGRDVDPQALEKLRLLLDQAQDHDLMVVVTLFDFRTDYRPILWTSADRHLEAVVGAVVDHPAILAWDLKNEPDLDYAAAGERTVQSWLRHTAEELRLLDPVRPVTIGWSSPQAAHALTDVVDLVSFHFYGPAEELSQQVAALRTAVDGRPLLLGEFGLPTWNSALFPHGHTEAEQASYYAALLETVRQEELGYLAWTLYDFDHVPGAVVGLAPWKRGPQRHLGVVRADGRFKPAAALLSPDAVLDVPTVPGYARFLKPFWRTVAVILVSLCILSWMFFRRLRRLRQTF